MTPKILLIFAFDLILIIAALDDVRRLRISNIIPLAIISLFVLRIVLVGADASLWQNLASFGAVLLGGALLFARGILGGGDAKLLASVALWFDFAGLAILLPAVAIFGGCTALLLVIVRRMIPARALAEGSWVALRRRGPIPYAVPICVGAIMTAHLAAVL